MGRGLRLGSNDHGLWLSSNDWTQHWWIREEIIKREREREIQSHCLACACIQLLKVTSLYCLILPLSSFILSMSLVVYISTFWCCSKTQSDLSLSECSEFNHVKTTAIYTLYLVKKTVVFFKSSAVIAVKPQRWTWCHWEVKSVWGHVDVCGYQIGGYRTDICLGCTLFFLDIFLLK